MVNSGEKAYFKYGGIYVIAFKNALSKNTYAQLLMGEKNILINTASGEYAEELSDTVEELIGVKRLDAVILTHAAPEHTEALGRLLDINPELTVTATAAGLRNAREILNRDFKETVAKDGASVSIGSGELKFIITPNLEWPDTMLIEYGDALLGGNLFVGVKDYKAYIKERFSGNIDFLLGAYNKIGAGRYKTLYPLLGDSPRLTEGTEEYLRIGQEAARELRGGKKPVIIYAGAGSYTKALAEIAAKTFDEYGAEYELINCAETSEDEVVKAFSRASCLCIGTRTLHGGADPKVAAPIIKAELRPHIPCMIFGTYGWSGEGTEALKHCARAKKLKVFEKPFKCIMRPSEEELCRFGEYAKRFIDFAKENKVKG